MLASAGHAAILAILIGLQRIKVAAQLTQLQGGVVVALLCLFSSVIERVNLLPDIIDVRFGAAGTNRHHANGDQSTEPAEYGAP
ncbi:MAG: hypothetical protein ACRCYU_05145 [Nocardioides sp.]